MTILIIIAIYAAGYYLAFSMLRVEHESEKRPYTYGDRLVSLSISIGSFLSVVGILIATWVKKIAISGYWSLPIKPVSPAKKEDPVK